MREEHTSTTCASRVDRIRGRATPYTLAQTAYGRLTARYLTNDLAHLRDGNKAAY
jgi:hypothetical protein